MQDVATDHIWIPIDCPKPGNIYAGVVQCLTMILLLRLDMTDEGFSLQTCKMFTLKAPYDLPSPWRWSAFCVQGVRFRRWLGLNGYSERKGRKKVTFQHMYLISVIAIHFVLRLFSTME